MLWELVADPFLRRCWATEAKCERMIGLNVRHDSAIDAREREEFTLHRG